VYNRIYRYRVNLPSSAVRDIFFLGGSGVNGFVYHRLSWFSTGTNFARCSCCGRLLLVIFLFFLLCDCNATHGLAMEFLFVSVHPSVCQTCTLCITDASLICDGAI